MVANLIEALEAWISAQPEITDLLAGAAYIDDSPPGDGPQLPSLTFSQKTGRVQNLVGTPASIQWPEVSIEVQAEYAEEARRIAWRVRDLILDGPPLAWHGGREAGRSEGDGEGGELEEGVGPDGSDVWVHRVPINFCITRD